MHRQPLVVVREEPAEGAGCVGGKSCGSQRTPHEYGRAFANHRRHGVQIERGSAELDEQRADRVGEIAARGPAAQATARQNIGALSKGRILALAIAN